MKPKTWNGPDPIFQAWGRLLAQGAKEGKWPQPKSMTALENCLRIVWTTENLKAECLANKVVLLLAKPGTWRQAWKESSILQARTSNPELMSNGMEQSILHLLTNLHNLKPSGQSPSESNIHFTEVALAPWFQNHTVQDQEKNQWTVVRLEPEGENLVLMIGHQEKREKLLISPRKSATCEGLPSNHLTITWKTPLENTGDTSPNGPLLEGFTEIIRENDSLFIDVIFKENVTLRETRQNNHPILPGEPQASDPMLVLKLESECNQTCVFCSMGEMGQKYDANESTIFNKQIKKMEEAFNNGIRRLTVVGIDPLTYPRIEGLLLKAKSLGFEWLNLHSPFSNPLENSLIEIFSTWENKIHLFIPLYGAQADTHELVTGKKGSFKAVTSNLALLKSKLNQARITICTVTTKQNLVHLGKLHELCQKRNLPMKVYLPFPTALDCEGNGTADKHFEEACPPYQLIAENLLKNGMSYLCAELPPCAYWWAAKDRSISWPNTPYWKQAPLSGTLSLRSDKDAVAGEKSHDKKNTLPCKHANNCDLASQCRKEHYQEYIRCHGWESVKPVPIGMDKINWNMALQWIGQSLPLLALNL